MRRPWTKKSGAYEGQRRRRAYEGGVGFWCIIRALGVSRVFAYGKSADGLGTGVL